jgi:rod shape determining protein RodA
MRRILSFRDFDWLLLGLVLTLCTISVLEIYSATLHTKYAASAGYFNDQKVWVSGHAGYHTEQMLWIAAGLVAMFIFARIDYHKLIDLVP